ncbi:MAG: DUF6020 family protein [Propionibacteriaceae bacterium]|jgi:hypothetical protein|nr:DUF6020 family protein [Propionibacteriaceae bacterium]
MRKDVILALVGSVCAVLALAIEPATDDGIISALKNAEGNNVSWVVVFLALAFFGRHVLRQIRVEPSARKAAILVGVLLGVAWTIGQSISVADSLEPLWGSGVSTIVKTLVVLAGFSWLVFLPCGWLFAWNCRQKLRDHSVMLREESRISSLHESQVGSTSMFAGLYKQLSRSDQWINKHPRWTFGLVFSSILVVRLVWLWVLYPGVVTNDSSNQLMQALGLYEYSTHHPLVHTLVISIFARAGEALGNLALGVCLFGLFQCIATSAVVAYVLWRMRSWGVSIGALTAVYAVFLLYPIHGVFAVTLWKDIPFGYAVLVLMTVIIDAIRKPLQGRYYWRLATMLLLAGASVYIFRNNGPFVLIAGMVALMIILRHQWKRIVPIALAPIVLGAGIIFVSNAVLDPILGAKREALSIPLQQIARTCHSSELSSVQEQFVFQLFSGATCDEVGKRYVSWISDPVKNIADDEFITSDMGRFLEGWASIGADHPGEYVTSFLAGGYGYWYPTNNHWVALTEIINTDSDNEILTMRESGFGRITSKNHPELVSTLDFLLLKPNGIPVMSMGWSVGFLVWLATIGVAAGIVRDRAKYILSIAVPLGVLWLTCIASPVYAEYRYTYGLVTSLPLLLVISFARWRELHSVSASE